MAESCCIDVSVTPKYMSEHSEPEDGRYVFAYHISIRNRGEMSAQLHSRHWIITDGNGKIEEVRGEGVVGEQPVIEPGGEHRYSSFCVLETPVGMMQGSYRMIAGDGTAFEAEIPLFRLAVPNRLN